MRSIAERITGFVRVQWKDIPQKDGYFDLCENAPDNGSRLLSNYVTFRWPLNRYPPPCGVFVNMRIVCEGKPCSPAAAIAKIAPNPYRINILFCCSLKYSQQRL